MKGKQEIWGSALVLIGCVFLAGSAISVAQGPAKPPEPVVIIPMMAGSQITAARIVPETPVRIHKRSMDQPRQVEWSVVRKAGNEFSWVIEKKNPQAPDCFPSPLTIASGETSVLSGAAGCDAGTIWIYRIYAIDANGTKIPGSEIDPEVHVLE